MTGIFAKLTAGVDVNSTVAVGVGILFKAPGDIGLEARLLLLDLPAVDRPWAMRG
jgi:hypothetical protein